jgi:hypothetical protein
LGTNDEKSRLSARVFGVVDVGKEVSEDGIDHGVL